MICACGFEAEAEERGGITRASNEEKHQFSLPRRLIRLSWWALSGKIHSERSGRRNRSTQTAVTPKFIMDRLEEFLDAGQLNLGLLSAIHQKVYQETFPSRAVSGRVESCGVPNALEM